MALWNPYKNYDQGMDDAYVGKESQNNSSQYRQGYERAMQLEEEEIRKREEKPRQDYQG
jgi:hypothetical protein